MTELAPLTHRDVVGPRGDRFRVCLEHGSFPTPTWYAAAGRRVGGRARTWRTRSIEGLVRNHAGRSRAATGLADARSAFDDRGHLIADRFGGPSGARSGNIVPMHALVNSSDGNWFQMEEHIARLLGGGTGIMRVVCEYHSNSIRPDLFKVTFVGAGGHVSAAYWNHTPHLAPGEPFEPPRRGIPTVEELLSGLDR